MNDILHEVASFSHEVASMLILDSDCPQITMAIFFRNQ